VFKLGNVVYTWNSDNTNQNQQDIKYVNFQLIPDVILVGRFDGCDIKLPASTRTSRLNAVIFPLLDSNTLLIVDVGSICGVKTLQRTSGEPLVSSLPNARRPIMVKITETASFSLGDGEQILVWNPKECVVCMASPREVEFQPCKHFAVCRGCSNNLTTCPLCREPIVNLTKVDFRVHSAQVHQH